MIDKFFSIKVAIWGYLGDGEFDRSLTARGELSCVAIRSGRGCLLRPERLRGAACLEMPR